MAKSGKSGKQYRSAEDGRFTTKKAADAKPDKHVAESRKPKKSK